MLGVPAVAGATRSSLRILGGMSASILDCVGLTSAGLVRPTALKGRVRTIVARGERSLRDRDIALVILGKCVASRGV
jgi:hypothetical protein